MKKAIDASHSLEQPMSWTLRGRPPGGEQRMLAVKDQVVYNILRTNAEQGWERPYFSVTTPANAHLDLEPYFQLEGLAQRVVPIRHEAPQGRVVPGLTDERFSSFRLTNLDDPDVYYGDTARGTIGTHYRLWPAHTARALADQGHPQRAQHLLDRFTAEVPLDVIPADTSIRLRVAEAYQAVEAYDQAKSIAQSTEPHVLQDLRTATNRQQMALALRAAGSLRSLYRKNAAQEALTHFDARLTAVLDDLPGRLPADMRGQFGVPNHDSTS